MPATICPARACIAFLICERALFDVRTDGMVFVSFRSLRIFSILPPLNVFRSFFVSLFLMFCFPEERRTSPSRCFYWIWGSPRSRVLFHFSCHWAWLTLESCGVECFLLVLEALLIPSYTSFFSPQLTSPRYISSVLFTGPRNFWCSPNLCTAAAQLSMAGCKAGVG